jgi:broad specificity phosphatase PhoE
MTMFHLIRHAEHDLLGRELVGRRPGVHLNERGRAQAARLAAALAEVRLDAVLSSPRERAWETAEPIAARQERSVTAAPALDEIDFGEWTGRAFSELESDPRWHRFNRVRSIAVVPGGELLLEAQARVARLMDELRQRYRQGRVALVSHGDVIRGALTLCMGLPLDAMPRVEASPAALNTIVVDEGAPQVLALNVRFDGRL